MASLKDTEQLTKKLEDIVGELRSELSNGNADFQKIVSLADELSCDDSALFAARAVAPLAAASAAARTTVRRASWPFCSCSCCCVSSSGISLSSESWFSIRTFRRSSRSSCSSPATFRRRRS